ncbi:MAG: hypothetical protein V3W37_08175 [Candidatus Binatia bacterium]
MGIEDFPYDMLQLAVWAETRWFKKMTHQYWTPGEESGYYQVRLIQLQGTFPGFEGVPLEAPGHL